MESIYFENTMRLFWGDKAYQIACSAYSPKERKKWYKKTITKISKVIDTINTENDHKQCLMILLDQLRSNITKLSNKIKNFDIASYKTIDTLFRLLGTFLGYSPTKGKSVYSLVYWQTKTQYYNKKNFLENKDSMLSHHDKKDTISIRKNIVKDLKTLGLNTFKISLVLNTTEYEIKKLRGN